MMRLLWAAVGITAGAAVLHGTLGMRRPRDRAHLSFACMMTFLAVYFYLGAAVYRATTTDMAVEAVRRQVFAVLGCHACLLVFVPAYTRVKIPRLVMAVYWGGLALLLVTNLLAPHGLWFSGQPELVHSTFWGERYQAVVAPPMSLPQHAYAIYFTSFLIVALACAVKLFRRGERLRSGTFGAALALVLTNSLLDVIRDNVGGSWPYVAELGFVAWALIMSVQLARDFRAQAVALEDAILRVEAQAERMRAMLDALRALEQNMHVPLEMLEAGVATLRATTPTEDERLHRLRRAVRRLREFARVAGASAIRAPASRDP